MSGLYTGKLRVVGLVRERDVLASLLSPFYGAIAVPSCHALSLLSSLLWTSHAACAIAITGVRQ